MKTILTLPLLALLIYSCAAPKYGLHFQNTNQVYSQKTKTKEISNPIATSIQKPPPQTVIASSTVNYENPIPVERKDEVKYDLKSRSELTGQVVGERKAIKKEIKNKRKKSPKTKKSRKEKPTETKRKTEPLGLASFGLLLLTFLLFSAEGAVGLSTGFGAILILMATIGGGVSKYKIKSDKKRWKGGFFGMFAAIVGGIFLFLLTMATLLPW